MPNEPYLKTYAVTAHETDATAQQYNSLMAEVKAAAEGIPTHGVTIAITYTGLKPATITIIDQSPEGDGGFDITCVATLTWTGWQLTEIQYVFDTGEMNTTVTETYTWVGWQLTAIERTIT